MDKQCDTCLLYDLCKDCKLPHCNGEDYVHDKYAVNKQEEMILIAPVMSEENKKHMIEKISKAFAVPGKLIKG